MKTREVKTIVTRTAKDNKSGAELPVLSKYYTEPRDLGDGPIAEVAASVDFKITANYQSVGVSCSVSLPVLASITEIEEGQNLAIELARNRLQKEINRARKDLVVLSELRRIHD